MSDANPPVLPPAEPSFAERWVADFRLLALLCARTYGSIAIVSLIGLNALAWALTREPVFVVGCAAGLAAAFLAYLNFSIVAANGSERGINVTMISSIAAGFLSALTFVSLAL